MVNLVVFFGGESCEHDVSIITGLQFISKVNEYLYNIIPIYIDKNGDWLTGKNLKDLDNFPDNLGKTVKVGILDNDKALYKIGKSHKAKKICDIDVAVICLHGAGGEDGVISASLESSKIPYINSSIMPSAVCMDKIVFDYIVAGMGIAKVDFLAVTKFEYDEDKSAVLDRIKNFGFPIIIKPARLGSSIGINVCKNYDDLERLLENSFEFDCRILIERYVNVKKEVNIACFLNKNDIVLSKTEEPISKHEILDFGQKYVASCGMENMKRIMPANISKEQYENIVDILCRLYSALNMFGVVRFDFFIDENDKLYINEVNTIPGSMAYYLFEDTYSYPELIDMWLTNALIRNTNAQMKVKDYSSSILKQGLNGFKK